jgi:hypothetical protein
VTVVYLTLCCGFKFFGMNHTPEWEGKCRRCGGEYVGEKAKGDE